MRLFKLHSLLTFSLANGRLPALKSVTKYPDYLRSVDSYSVEYNVTLDLMNHSVKYNVNTPARKTVQCRLTVRLEKLSIKKTIHRVRREIQILNSVMGLHQQVNACLVSFPQMTG